MSSSQQKKQKKPGGFRGNWVTSNEDAIETWINQLRSRIEEQGDAVKIHPVIEEYRELINHDAVVRMYVNEMIDQIAEVGAPQHPKDVDDMLSLLNAVLTQAPEFNNTALVGCPMSAVLVWTMGTPAGFAAYTNEKINAMLKKILDVWKKYLDSEASRYVLNDSDTGWKCSAAQAKLHMDSYQYDKDDEYWGFGSWNEFFSRKLRKDARPIDEPNNNKVIVSACDSTVHMKSVGVNERSKFWIKSQPYSLKDMLADDKLAAEFHQGTVYQAYLDPFNYHHWHSPVAGTIKSAHIQPGLYFGQDSAIGEDPTAQGYSEGYVAHVQTRAIICIDCDDENIGLMCVVPVGMVEISSCVILDQIKPNYHVEKGEELGYFQFGGSTHCLVFRRGAIKELTARLDTTYYVGQQIGIAN